MAGHGPGVVTPAVSVQIKRCEDTVLMAPSDELKWLARRVILDS